MSGTHKYPTISFRISPREREEIEAKIFTSGMKKKDYFVRSCIYNRVCVVGKKETVYQIVERLQEMENRLVELAEQIDGKKPGITSEEIRDLREAYEDMLKAILWMLDGARYLWQGEEKSPDSGNCEGCDNWKTSVINNHNSSIAEVSSGDNEFFKNGGHYGRNENRITDD